MKTGAQIKVLINEYLLQTQQWIYVITSVRSAPAVFEHL